MEKESYFGNIEYKRYIKFSTDKKKTSLTSQLKFRLREGNGNCIYRIGVEDNGEIYNISENCYNESLENIKEMCKEADAEIFSVEKKYTVFNTDKDKYYYEIAIHDKITNNEVRILNITNKSSIELYGIDSSNNLLTVEEHTVYDIKKQSKYLVYVNNFNYSIFPINIIKTILTYKPHLVNFSIEVSDLPKIISLLDKMIIEYIFNETLFTEKIVEMIPKLYINNFYSKNLMNIFHILFNGNIFNNTKIYACITNKNMLYNHDNIFLRQNDEPPKKIKINDIQHIYQSVYDIKKNKLVSISTDIKINNDYHICDNNNCIIPYTDIIKTEIHLDYKTDENKEYIGYYKNNVLKVKFFNDGIMLNKKIYIDEKYLIIDLNTEYLLINLL
jgi:hypothetical protein